MSVSCTLRLTHGYVNATAAEVELTDNGDKEEVLILAMKKLTAAKCVYTILHPDRLAEAATLRGPSTFAIKQRWVTGCALFQAAEAAGEALAILFGDATDCSRLIYWGLLQGVNVSDEDTHYTAFPIRAFRAQHRPQELVLGNSGENIADGFIRAYALCRTPDFLRNEVRRAKA